MKRKNFIKTFATFCAVSGLLSCSLTAYATTVDDVAEVARELGYSEDLIEQGYNNYYADPDLYPSERLDELIEELYLQKDKIMTTGPQVTTQPQETTSTTTATDGGTSSDGSENQQVTGGITLETGDGTEFTRIPSNEFMGLSYEEKTDYIRTFTPEQQQVILDNLTPEERRNIMKQLSMEQKMDIVDSMVEVGEGLGINISVEEISDDNISLSMRNSEGEFVGMVNASTLVEDTGYDRRGIFAVSGGFFMTAVAMICAVYGSFRKNGEKNER
ncbi:MAG: hypothetical protein K2J08_11755 [Ruminococcus sp.]|nr:hypothetical protein [Ruminococcus sp.]